MSLPHNLFSAAFQNQKLGFLMSLIMIIMVYVGSLALAAQAMLARSALAWGHDLENRVTVEVPSSFREDPILREQKGQKILEAVRAMPDIMIAKPISKKEMGRLLKTWVNDEKLLDVLPLPYLIDVQLEAGTKIDIDEMKANLSKDVDTVLVHMHAGWMGSLMGFVRGLAGLATVMLLLTGLSIVAVVSIVCRAAISAQHNTISLLHYMGATDQVIAFAVQTHIKKLAVPACLIGFAAAVVTVLLLAVMLGVMGGLSLIAPLGIVTMGLTMALVPVVAGLLSYWTARLSVLRLLRRL